MRVVTLLAGCGLCAAAAGCGQPPPLRDESRAAAQTPAAVESWPVNGNRAGLRVDVRWMLAPDRRALLVVHDPVSVEADPIPDGFLYASEASGTVVQVDGVWDVAPSPAWDRLAYGRAYELRAGEHETMPPGEWLRVEAQLPEDLARPGTKPLRRDLEAHAFPISGMTFMLGLGITQVIWLDRLGPGRAAAPSGATHSLHGWRVRWTRSGDSLGVGTAPRITSDDEPPARWVLVRPRVGAAYRDSLGGTSDSGRFAPVRWVKGPTMEYGAAVDVTGRRELAVDGGVVEGRDGVVLLTTLPRDGRGTRIVGPGTPLAATATGRFIAAVVATPDAEPGRMRGQLVVYHVPPR